MPSFQRARNWLRSLRLRRAATTSARLIPAIQSIIETLEQRTLLAVMGGPPVLGPVNIDKSSINEGDSVLVSGSFTDPDSSDTHTVSIDWGDGTVDALGGPQFTQLSGGGNYNASHQYKDDGPSPGNGTPADNYNVAVTITDNHAASGT